MTPFKKYVFIFLGTFFVLLGLIGLLLPIIPTTPFLLVAGIFYINSSNTLYQWLIKTKYFGPQVKRYVEYKEISKRTKIITLLIIWIPTLITVIFIVKHPILRLISLLIGLLFSSYIILAKTGEDE